MSTVAFLWYLGIRLVWFVVFLRLASRAHALSGRNMGAGFLTGAASALLSLPLTYWWGWTGEEERSPLDDFIMLPLEGFYFAFLLPLLFGVRYVLRLRGLKRDFWLMAACLAPLFLIFFIVTAIFLIVVRLTISDAPL